MNPIPFHASNILLHALVTCMVYKCGRLISELPESCGNALHEAVSLSVL